MILRTDDERLLEAGRAAARRLADGAPPEESTLAEIRSGVAVLQPPRITSRSADRYVRRARAFYERRR